DVILVARDEIAIRPDEQPVGLQTREAVYSALVPSCMVSGEDRKKLGNYLLEAGKLILAENGNCAVTDCPKAFNEAVMGPPKKKAKA
ncbi:MAG: hypothetical protein AAFQ92_30020, partial [Bacteroidota bacterium]